MDGFVECPTCRQMCFIRGHRCKPQWWVRIGKGDWNHDPDEEPMLVRADTRIDAAEDFAERWDNAGLDCTIIGGDVLLVDVWPYDSDSPPDDTSEKETFTVTGSIVYHYHAELACQEDTE